jgi:hypothetical protein
MRGRRQNDDWIWLVAELMGVLVLFGLIWPQTRQVICAVGVLAVCIVSITGTGLIGFGIYRFVSRSQCAEAGQYRVLDGVGCASEKVTEAAPDNFGTDQTTGLDESGSGRDCVSGCREHNLATAEDGSTDFTAAVN